MGMNGALPRGGEFTSLWVLRLSYCEMLLYVLVAKSRPLCEHLRNYWH